MMRVTGHVDRFAEDRLPADDDMPEVRLDVPALRYPERLNAAAVLLDRVVERGDGDRRCIVASGIVWTYADLRAAANTIANALVRDYGVRPGHRVLLRAPNTPMLAACWFAVVKTGGIAVTTMPLYRAAELRHMIDKAQVNLALCDRRLKDELTNACDGGRDVPIAYFGSGERDDLDDVMRRRSTVFKNADTAAQDVAIIAFTSGTTGKPKAAMHYHRDLIATCDTYGTQVLQPRADDLFCGSAPLGFTFGLGGHLLFPLYAGAATLLLESARPDDLLRAIEGYRVTTLFTAPIAYRAMCAGGDECDLSSLRTCVSAGETLPRAIWEAWYARTHIKILDGIGSTEMLHIFIGSPLSQAQAGSTGKPVPGYVAEVHDENGRPVADGTIGRLAVKGPTGCKYLEDDRQRTYVRNGWNYPGDAYRRDERGYFWYVARTDDIIVSAGYNICGPEVEEVLLGHPAVREAAVVGKLDLEKETSIVKAYVVLHDPQRAGDDQAQQLRDYCKASIAPFKAPREVEFVLELPRTETGKVQRYKLRTAASP